MAYIKQTWENNPPSTATPISASRLAHLETQYDEAIATLEPTVSEVDTLSDTVNTGRLSEAGLNAMIAGAHSQNVAGAVTVTVMANHLYELTATSAATVTLTGAEGTQVVIRWSGTSGTVEGQPVSAGQTWVAARWVSGWVLYEVGGSGGGGGAPASTGWIEQSVPEETLGTAQIQWFLRRDGGIVHLKARINGAPGGTSLGTIPVGYRMTPAVGEWDPRDMAFPLIRGGTTNVVNAIRVQYGNQVSILAQSTVNGLCQVSWPTDDPWPQ